MFKANLATNVGVIEFNNPIILASGIVSAGKEYSELIDLNVLGGIVTKTITLKPRPGNVPPRLFETPSGMLNSIGLQNNGFDNFLNDYGNFLNGLKCKVIVSIAGSTDEDFIEVAKLVDELDFVAAIEANFSCPNVDRGGIAYGSSTEGCSHATKMIRNVVKNKPLWVKLSPQVADIASVGLSAQENGADAICAINTVPGIEINPFTFKAELGNVFGGLSGSAIRPVALKAIHNLCRAVKIPVVGIGGISDHLDVAKFVSLGAKAVQVGSAMFNNPHLPIDIVNNLGNHLDSISVTGISELTGRYFDVNEK